MLLFLALLFIWLFLTGDFTSGNIVFGLILSWAILYITGRGMMVNLISPWRDIKILRYSVTLIRFMIFFFRELISAGLTVFASILAPHLLSPGVIAVPLDLKTNAEITLLANLITLTPGTLSLDVSTDRKVIYVHTILVRDPDEFREGIKNGFEKRVMEVMRP